MEKKIFTLKGTPYGVSIFSESKEEMLKLWDLLQEGNFKTLSSDHDWDDDEMYFWPGDLKVQLEAKTIYLYENKDKANKAKAAYKHAKKVGIISKKKKKS